MSRASSLILPAQLLAARNALGLSRGEVARHLGVSEETIEQWEKGVEEAPVELLWQLADLYRRDIDYFLDPHASSLPSLSFRLTKRADLSDLSIATRQTIVAFEELCRAAREIERILELPKPEPLPFSTDLTGEPLASAERIRLNLGDRPVADIRSLLEGQGILCFHLRIPGDEFAGLSWHHQEYGPCLLVNGSDNPGRRAFTTAHEYAHLLRRDGNAICDLEQESLIEQTANRFAVIFLMPETDVRDTFLRRGLDSQGLTIEQLATLARRYGVSLEAMGLRLEELRLLRAGATSDLTRAQPPSRYYGRSRPSWRKRVGETYTERALEAYTTGRVSIGKLARYLDIDIRQALDLVEPSEGPR